jgi:hypothetical protein
VDWARDGYRGEGKTDARDALVIIDQARMRHSLGELMPGKETLAQLQFLVARRRDPITDQSRTITRLREALLSLFPALERAFELSTKDALALVAHYHTPAQLQLVGRKRIATYLTNRGVKGADGLAQKALNAARAQSDRCPSFDDFDYLLSEILGVSFHAAIMPYGPISLQRALVLQRHFQ